MAIQGPVLVVGATGNVGRRVAEKLAAKGVPVRAVARDPSELRGRKNVEAVPADLTRPEEARRVVQGVTMVYLTPAESGSDPLASEKAIGENVIRAAKEAKVKHLIMHSAIHADKGRTGVGILDNKHHLEQRLRESGVPHTVLRPGWFLQNLMNSKQSVQDGTLTMPIPADRRIAATSVEDVARAAVMFFEKGPQNKAFDIHVDRGMDSNELCQALGQAAGSNVEFQEFDGPSTLFVEDYPITEEHKRLFGELFDYFRRTEYLGRPEDIRRALPEFRPTTAEQFARTEMFAQPSAPAR